MPEVTLEMLLSGAKPASAPMQAALTPQGAVEGAGVDEAGAAPEGEESFSSALSRQMKASEGEASAVEEAAAEPAEEVEAEADPEAKGAVESAVAESEGDGEPGEEIALPEVELPPGLEFLDLPVAAVTLPQGGSALPLEGAAAVAAGDSPLSALAANQPARPAELVLSEGEGDPAAARRQAVAAAVAAAVAQPAEEGEGESRTFNQLLGGRLAAAATQPSAGGEGAASSAPTLTAVQSAAAGTTPAQATAPTQPPVRSAIDTPFRQPGWNDSLGNRVVWMANEKIEKAEIRLNPPTLGPIEVRVTMNGDQASVSFVSQNPNVRDALEQAMPRLREMMGENGLNLAEADVSDAHRDQRAQEEGGEGDGRGRGQGGDGVEGDDEGVGGEAIAVGDGMLDLYA